MNQIKYRTLSIFLIILCIILPIFSFPVVSQEPDETESAQVAILIDGDLPPIQNNNWTNINLTLFDQFGINWDRLKVYKIRTRLIWPITLGPYVRRFTGYTSIELYPEIIEGDPTGWEVRMNDSVIPEADQGRQYSRILQVQTNRLDVDYSVTIGIRIIRRDVWGDIAGESYAYIPVKTSPFNYLDVKSVNPSIKASPKSIVNFQIDITNRGYYEDLFQFDIKSNDGLFGIANEQSINIKPGETKRVSIGVLTKESFYDPGTPHVIDIYAYSLKDPTKIMVGNVVIITEGIYITPLVWIILIPIIIILLVIYFIFFYLKQKKEQELFGKPKKPWKIPEEKKHLEELKQKDKQAYEKERLMMEDEYKSALLWYDDQRQSIRNEQHKPKSNNFNSKLNEFFKKPETKKEKTIKNKKEKPPKKEKKTSKKKEKPVEKEEKPKETPEIIKDQYTSIKKRSAESERKKQVALEKIRRAQEKQKKKMK